MAGHPALTQVKTDRSTVAHAGRCYTVELSYHTVTDLKGYAVGVKFTDMHSSMDSSKKVNTDGYSLGNAIGERVVRMTKNLKDVSFLGFYLLTDDLEKSRGEKAVISKIRLYRSQAVKIHKKVSHKLPELTQIKVNGGVGWGMGEKNFLSKPNFETFLLELSKAFEVLEC